MNALKRFTSRKGYLKTLISDNGTNSTLAAKVLHDKYLQEKKQNITDTTLQVYLTNDRIIWKFITQNAP